MADRRRPRGPGIVYGVVSVVTLVVVGVVALTATQPPPPTIAEFAPQAVEQIEDAPVEQTSEFGTGDGGALLDAAAPTPTPGAGRTPEPIVGNRVNKCVGDPPRQTEDPQSPPCVPYWTGDNGGRTWKGVTRDEIRVVMPSNYSFNEDNRTGRAILAHFNSRYEFYGRKIVPMELPSSGEAGGTARMIANATAADEELKVFASTQYGDASGHEYVYYDELARRQIVSVNGRPSMLDEQRLQRFHPYQWSYLPGVDTMSRQMGQWICRSLHGRNADFAGGTEAGRPRVFGLVTSVTEEGARPDLAPMREEFSRCGVEIAEEAEMHGGMSTREGFQEAQNAVIAFQVADVNSVICMCHTGHTGLRLYPAATAQGFMPEWLISTYMYQAEDTHARTWEASHVERSFGLSWWSKQVPPHDSPWFWAAREGGADEINFYDARWFYNSMLMLASGIQLAGPDLNPTTFAEGLMRARFPNPKHGDAPYWQGHVGFGAGDHTAVNDAAIVWLTRSQRSPWDNQPGTTCHALRGKRYRTGEFPSGYAGLYEACT